VAAVVLFASLAAGETMANDPLPLPDIFAEPTTAADGDPVYSQIAASGRQRGLITEYPSRSRHSDNDKLVATIGRLDAAAHNDAPGAADFVQRLVDLTATIARIEAVLEANGTSTPDVHFAAERIQDIAFSLRQRDVEPAVCDTLEGAIREVGDAIVRNDAAAASAAALLRDLARGLNDAIELSRYAAGRLGDIAPGSAAESVGARGAREDGVGSPLPSPPIPSALPVAEAANNAADLFELASLPIPSPLDGNEDAVRAQSDEGEAASESFSDNAAASVFIASDSEKGEEALPTTAPQTLRPADLSPAAATNQRAAPRDPSAAFLGLSEEELAALFS
jgi:hypothetical protein